MYNISARLPALIGLLGDGAPIGKAVLGFDAFVDRITRPCRMNTMKELGDVLLSRQEHSFTVNLENAQTRAGGNMPNTALGLAGFGCDAACVGALGQPAVHPAFAPLAQGCEVFSFGDPGLTLALEFGQGKLFLGEPGCLSALNWASLCRDPGLDTLRRLYAQASLIGIFNFGELDGMQDVLNGVLRDVLPGLPNAPRLFFFDPSDLSGRTDGEVREYALALARFRPYGRVVLSANQGESQRLCAALGSAPQEPGDCPAALLGWGVADLVILHSAHFAWAADAAGRFALPTRYTDCPLTLTGAGDHFNAGVLLGLLYGLDTAACLALGNASSSLYVRNAASPTRRALGAELTLCADLWA
ncbi:MAG: PfkB family carbohydrate kinase [Eubacteriales bacterium]|nr:PfkB family carbohydrate kinase [Eubacteriales bacterium]